MPEMEVEFEVLCGRCGAGLCVNTRTSYTYNRHIPQVTVEPCKNCIDAAVKSAEAEEYDRGYDQGYKDGLRDGEWAFDLWARGMGDMACARNRNLHIPLWRRALWRIRGAILRWLFGWWRWESPD